MSQENTAQKEPPPALVRNGQVNIEEDIDKRHIWVKSNQSYPMIRLIGWGFTLFMLPLMSLMYIGGFGIQRIPELLLTNFIIMILCVLIDRAFLSIMRMLVNPYYTALVGCLGSLLMIAGAFGESYAGGAALGFLLLTGIMVLIARLNPAGKMDIVITRLTLTPKGKDPIPLEEIKEINAAHGRVWLHLRDQPRVEIATALRKAESDWLVHDINHWRNERRQQLEADGHNIDQEPHELARLRQARSRLTTR